MSGRSNIVIRNFSSYNHLTSPKHVDHVHTLDITGLSVMRNSVRD